MALIAVGGQSKDVGKTTLITQILCAFPARSWTTVKITNHAHAPIGCELRKESSSWSIWEQSEAGQESDSARYLRAGAQRAFLLHADTRALPEAWLALRAMLPDAEDFLVESNRIAAFLAPDLFLLVVDPARDDFKHSAQEQLAKVDAIVWSDGSAQKRAAELQGKPRFVLNTHLDPRLKAWIIERCTAPKRRVREG